MGCDYSSTLAVGIPFRSVYTKNVTNTVETWYNEKTGEPYQKKIRRVEETLLGNSISDDFEIYEILAMVSLDFIFGDMDDESSYDRAIIGLTLSNVDARDNQTEKGFNIKEIIDKVEEMEEILTAIDVQEKVRVYHGVEVSC